MKITATCYVRGVLVCSFASLVLGATAFAAELKPATAAAFDNYARQAEAQILARQRSPQTFLALDTLPPAQREAAMARLRAGEVLIEKVPPPKVADGLMHHWRGTMLIPSATIAQLEFVLHDYPHWTAIYHPEVQAADVLAQNGADYNLRLRLREHRVITIFLEGEFAVHGGRLDDTHGFSLSHSTHMLQVADAGSASEHTRPEGDDDGFLWRLNSFWSFEQTSEGVIAECEAVSLTRNIPTGLGWLIGPFVQNVPRESLEFTLRSTRNTIQHQAAR